MIAENLSKLHTADLWNQELVAKLAYQLLLRGHVPILNVLQCIVRVRPEEISDHLYHHGLLADPSHKKLQDVVEEYDNASQLT